MLVELFLNQLPIAFYMMGFVGLYSCAFGLWALSVYVRKGLWCDNALAVSPMLLYMEVESTTQLRYYVLCSDRCEIQKNAVILVSQRMQLFEEILAFPWID